MGDVHQLLRDWRNWARPSQQIPPEGKDWRSWLILGGRGAGKTRAGAEWVKAIALGIWEPIVGRAERIAIVAPTFAEARLVMIEGKSGLLAIHGESERPMFEPSKRQLTWPNGCVAHVFSAEEPDGLRGPQFDAAWCDELAKWKHAGAVWDMLTIGVGHTAAAGGVAPKLGDRMTIKQAMSLFASDLAKFERRVEKSVGILAMHQNDALVSFDFNTGAIDGGSLDEKIKARDFSAAMDALEQYKKSGGVVLPGLVKRRARERAMFERGEYPVVTHIKVYDGMPGKMRRVPVASLDLSEFADSAETPAGPALPNKPRGLLAALIDLFLAVFKRRT